MVETRQGGEGDDAGNPSVRICEIVHHAGSCGFNLSKSKWDPYPWVSSVDDGSAAAVAGVLPGDCVLEVNGDDILGLRIAEVANRVRSRGDRATVMLWNPGIDHHCTPETLCCGPMPTNLQRLTTCMSNILAALECPICLETTTPPAHQCANGHLICVNCRVRTEKCPVCRLRFFRGRSLLADQVFESLIDAFDLRQEDASERSRLLLHRIYGPRKNERKVKPEIKLNLLSPTNKFLTRIMGTGKSSSVENLSADTNIQLSTEFYQGLKAKSLSSSEIFHGEPQTMSRTSSVLSSRPGSGLLDVNDIPFSPRPASYHGSAGDLHSRMLADFGIDMRSSPTDISLCPMAPECNARIVSSSLKRHLQDEHGGPIIQFFTSSATISPLWLMNPAVTVLECFESVFFVHAASNHLWVWLLHGNDKHFKASISIAEQQLHCTIATLNQTEDDDIYNYGIPLTNEVHDEAAIKVTIERST